MFSEFLEEESCGRCTTCHHGNQRMHEVFSRVAAGGGRVEDRHNLELVGSSLLYSNCVHGQASPTIMRNTLRFFEGEYNAHVSGHHCDALRCAGMTRLRVVDQSDPHLGEAQAICPTGAVKGEPGAYEIDDALCIRCGACTDVAPRGIAREAAPEGTATPIASSPRPPGETPAAGRMPLSFQTTGARACRGWHGRPAAGRAALVAQQARVGLGRRCPVPEAARQPHVHLDGCREVIGRLVAHPPRQILERL